MTQEKAIEILSNEKAYMLSHGRDAQAEAIDMVIETFRQCNDTISRDKAISAICHTFSKVVPSNPSKEVREILGLCKDNIRELPPVQTIRKGHWVKVVDYDYCPYCGTCMI